MATQIHGALSVLFVVHPSNSAIDARHFHRLLPVLRLVLRAIALYYVVACIMYTLARPSVHHTGGSVKKLKLGSCNFHFSPCGISFIQKFWRVLAERGSQIRVEWGKQAIF